MLDGEDYETYSSQSAPVNRNKSGIDDESTQDQGSVDTSAEIPF